MLLETNHVAKSFGELQVLKDVNLRLAQGHAYALVGTNGSGKTTLFNIIDGFLKPDKGELFFDQQKTNRLPAHRINALGISRTFQDLRLATELTVLENVLLSFKNQEGEKWWKAILPPGVYNKQQAQLREKAFMILEKTFLTEVTEEKAGEISYGQQKLLTLACCLANDARLLLLDEPVAGVNPGYQEKMVALLKAIKNEGRTILLIEHHAEFIEQTCDRVFFLNEGILSEFDNYEQLRNNQMVKEAYV